MRAVVLGHVDLGESDRVVRLLTEGQGRVDVVARGARASRRRFGGVLELGTILDATWRRGRGELATLETADLVRAPRVARAHYERLLLLGHGCEVIAALSARDVAGGKLLPLLERWLELLEGEAAPGGASRVAFEAKALTFAGLAPALVRCAVCDAPLAGAVRFDPEHGGAVHAWCGQGEAAHAAALSTIEALRRTPLSDTPGRDLPQEAAWLLASFLEHHVGHRLRGRALLMELPSS